MVFLWALCSDYKSATTYQQFVKMEQQFVSNLSSFVTLAIHLKILLCSFFLIRVSEIFLYCSWEIRLKSSDDGWKMNLLFQERHEILVIAKLAI